MWYKSGVKDLFIILLLFLSRILFLSPLPIYFDSPEYVKLIENPNLLTALTSGHEPIHPGYILLAWTLNKIFPFGAIYSAEIISSVFAALGFFIFFKIVQVLFDKKIAIRALIIASLLPVLFLSGVNVLTDTTYIFFYLLSFYFLLLFSRTNSKKWFILGVLSLAYAIFTHTQTILWLPLFLTPIILAKKKNVKSVCKQVLFFLFLGVFFGVSSLVFLLTLVGNSVFQSIQLLFMHGTDIYGTGSLLIDAARFLRNFGIILLRNNSTLVIVTAIIGSILLFRRDKKKFTVLSLWFLPTLLVTQYWHIGLFGRVALIASFPIAILVAQIKSRIIFFLIVLQLIIITIPLAIDNRNATVQKELVGLYDLIPKNSILISSNLIRPQVTYGGETYFINEPGQSMEFIESKIDLALKENKNVFIDSQALYNPYYAYDGNHLHVLSLGKQATSEVKSIFDRYQTRIVNTTSNPRIFLYQVDGSLSKPSKYVFQYSQQFQNRISSSRIDYRDIGTWVWVILSRRHEPISWSIQQ